jgi:hypothetical protein
MRRQILGLAILFLAVAATASAQPLSCEQMKSTFGDRPTVRASEELTIPAGPLNVSPGRNGGVTLIGSTGGSYRVQVCKSAEEGTDLSQIRPVVAGGSLTMEGPRLGSGWNVFLIIEVPAGSTLNVTTQNGPVSARGLQAARLSIDAKNGPIGVKESNGSIEAKTQNGPINVSGSSGDFRLAAQNGPVSVKLSDMQWNGQLVASTVNGPLSVSLPRDFRSGVLIESSGKGPINCDCEGARRTFDDDVRRIEFGSGPASVKLSVVNGPVSVKTR